MNVKKNSTPNDTNPPIVDDRKLLKYEKGEHRKKHLGRASEAEILVENGLLVGKCPKGFSLENAATLLKGGIYEFRATSPDRPFRIWRYFDSAIYAARSQDGGITWHGYPVPGDEVPQRILIQLEEQARTAGEESNIKSWLKKRWKK